jgi:hypothetical protein
MPVYYCDRAASNLVPGSIKINPRPLGQRISWNIPASTEGQKLIIERKATSIVAWTKIIEFSLAIAIDSISSDTADRFTMYYIDTARLEKIDYDYRLNYLTITNANPQDVVHNFSEIYTIRPYDNGLRGNFTSVAIEQLGSSSGTMQTIGLGWDYNTRFEGSLEEFKIYIRNPAKDDAFYLYNTVKVNKTKTNENGLRKLKTNSGVNTSHYSTRTQISKDQTVANFTPTSIQYKIVAIHRDGGRLFILLMVVALDLKDK